MVRFSRFLAVALVLVGSNYADAGIVMTFEAPGVQTSSAINSSVLDFNSANPGYHYIQDFNLTPTSTVQYVGNQFIEAASEYGGAGGTGQYLGIQISNSVTATLQDAQAYFGLWISAGDSGNSIEFYNGSSLIASFTESAIEALLGSAYFGNPNTPFQGENPTQPYVFVNFYAQTAADMFDSIVLKNGPTATEFESDNHTFSTTLQAPVPEPSAFALAALGLATLGGFQLRKCFKA